MGSTACIHVDLDLLWAEVVKQATRGVFLGSEKDEQVGSNCYHVDERVSKRGQTGRRRFMLK